MIRRVMFLSGIAILLLSAGLYFAEDRGVVSIDEPERELLLPAGTTTPLTFRINNPTRRAVRVVAELPVSGVSGSRVRMARRRPRHR